MPAHAGRFAAALLLALTLGCASTNTRAASQVDLITEGQIQAGHFLNAYEAVKALHAGWLINRGVTSTVMTDRVVVYRDGVRVGGVEELKDIPIGDVKYIRHYDGNEASARWGLDHAQGAIVVSTHPL